MGLGPLLVTPLRRHPAWRTVAPPGHALLRCDRDPWRGATTARVARNAHLPKSRQPSSIGEGSVRKSRHLCVRVLRTHPYRGGSRIFATRVTSLGGGSIRPHRRCATTDGVGGNRRSRGRLPPQQQRARHGPSSAHSAWSKRDVRERGGVRVGGARRSCLPRACLPLPERARMAHGARREGREIHHTTHSARSDLELALVHPTESRCVY